MLFGTVSTFSDNHLISACLKTSFGLRIHVFHGLFKFVLLVNIMFSKIHVQKVMMKTGCADLPELRYLLRMLYMYFILKY